jgi:hypothetical protein
MTGYQVTNSMVRSIHEVAMYTKIHIRYNVLISGILTISGNPLVSEVPDMATFTVFRTENIYRL